jgi:hypothetical protein
VAKGRVDLAALGLAQSDLVPSNGQNAGTAPAFVPAAITLVPDRTSAPADGKTAVTITATVKDWDSYNFLYDSGHAERYDGFNG